MAREEQLADVEEVLDKLGGGQEQSKKDLSSGATVVVNLLHAKVSSVKCLQHECAAKAKER